MAVEVGSAFISVRPSLSGFQNSLKRDLRRMGPSLVPIGREWGTQLQTGIKEKLNPIEVRLDTGQTSRQLVSLNRNLDRLDGRNVNVNIKVDVAGSMAELARLDQVLARLDGRTINININADAVAALAQLLLVNRELSRVDGQRAHASVDVDAGGALASIASVRMALVGLSLLSGPQLAAVGAGIIGLIGPLSAAGVGFGGLAAVAVPAISHITEATKQQEQATKASGAATGQATAQASAAAAARQQYAAAVRNAAYAHQQALEQVQSAELRVADAQRQARQAQEDLTRARADARRQLQDLANNLADARLGERQAVFDVADAEKELAKLRADPKATQDQIARQQLAVDRAKQQQKEQHLTLTRLIQDEAAARKAGVDGSDQVRAARDRLADANRRITESERALSSARANVARADQQSADQIASARRALAQASQQASTATGGLGQELVKLTPLEQQLSTAWKGLTGAFNEWARALQPAVLPLLIKGIGLLRGLLPALTPVVLSAAKAVDGLLDSLAAGLQSPFFKTFAADLARWAGPAITLFGQLVGNLLKGLAGIARAFAPIGFVFLGLLVKMTSAFASFAVGLTKSKGFQQFAAQMISVLNNIGAGWSQLMPLVAPIIGGLLKLLFNLGLMSQQIFRGLAAAVLPAVGVIVGALARAVNALLPVIIELIPALTPALTQIGDAVGRVVDGLASAVVQAAPAISRLVAAVVSLIPALLPLVAVWARWLTTIIPLIPAVLSIAATLATVLAPVIRFVIGIVVGLWTVFANLVLPVFRVLVAAVTWVASVLQPAFSGIGAAALWLWNNAIKPAFTLIGKLARWLYTIVAVSVMLPLIVIFKVVAGVATWLWKTVFVPAWNGIVAAARKAWANLRPVVNALGAGIRWVWTTFLKPTFDVLKRTVNGVAPYFRTAVDAIRSAWDKLRDAAKKPVAFVVNTIFNQGIVKLWNSVAKLVPGTKQLGEIHGFARGGIMPGYAPGKDRLLAAVSPGEAWMRPEWTRAVGPGLIKLWNDIARREGPAGVRKWFTGRDAMGGEGINFARGGTVPRFAGAFGLGGIVGGFAKGAKDFFVGGLMKHARKAFNPLIDLARRSIGGTGFGDLAVGVVRGLAANALRFFKPLDDKLGGGKGTARALAWARSQEGKPYGWGAVGPSAYDCSGFMSALTNVIKGHSPYRRLFTTFSFTGAQDGPAGFVRNLGSGFRVGVTNAGVGHMAGTLLGHNVESSGSAGVRVDSGARGANNGLFGMQYGLKFDSGGWLPPGISTVANFTGRPEAVLTSAQMAALADGSSGGSVTEYHAHLDGLTKAAHEAQVRAAFTAMQVQAAQRDRTGRRR